jgi:hypothetical protein
MAEVGIPTWIVGTHQTPHIASSSLNGRQSASYAAVHSLLTRTFTWCSTVLWAYTGDGSIASLEDSSHPRPAAAPAAVVLPQRPRSDPAATAQRLCTAWLEEWNGMVQGTLHGHSALCAVPPTRQSGALGPCSRVWPASLRSRVQASVVGVVVDVNGHALRLLALRLAANGGDQRRPPF